MDLNTDGNVDLLSGSYSRHEKGMAGLFQVLWGNQDGTFRAAEAVKGTDGQPLILPMGADENDVTDRICTRPFAVDLNGDGKLDIVAGNFTGTFGLFLGKGGGKFDATATWLETGDTPVAVDAHSDPFFVDWDKDGDLDLLSGSSQGGVFLFANGGTKKAPKFGPRQTILQAAGHSQDQETLGDAHVTKPSSSTRIWADDVNGDGKLDLLIGDSISLAYPAKGVEEASAKKQLGAWNEKQAAAFKKSDEKDFQAVYEALQKERGKIVRDDRTGFVWLMLQK